MKTATVEIHEGGKRITLKGSFIPASEAELNHLKAQIEEHKLVALAYPPAIELGELKLHVEFVPFAELIAMQERAQGLQLLTEPVPPATMSVAVPEGEELSDEDQAKLAELSGSGGLAGSAVAGSVIEISKPGTGDATVAGQGELPTGAQAKVSTKKKKAAATDADKAADTAVDAGDPTVQ